jgi:glutamyl-tRNA reductase
MMCFGYIGVRYNETPLAVRECVSFTDSKKIELMEKMQRIGATQCMVLSTCNRSEIFFFCPEEKIEQIRRCYEETAPGLDLSDYLRQCQGNEAIDYLFRVTAGLESLVLGEDQILGQVVEALELSQTMGYSGKELNKVVRDGIRCAKKIKTELHISEKPLSVSYVAVQQLEKYCAEEEYETDGFRKKTGICGKNILIIGSGKTAALALTHLYEHSPKKIYVCNRTMAHTKELRDRFPDVKVREYSERYEIMQDCDIVVSATASPHLVVTEENYNQYVRPYRKKKVQYFLDLAAPRDIDFKLSEQDNVKIIDMDFLQNITEKNQRDREILAEKSRSMIEEGVRELLEWFHVSRMDETIESLQKRCSDIVEDSFSYLNRKLDLSSHDGKLVRKVLNASLQRLLKEPIRELKHLDTEEEQEEYKEMIQRLFNRS